MEGWLFAQTAGWVSGTDTYRLRNEEKGASGYITGSVTTQNASPRVARLCANVLRDGTQWKAQETVSTSTYANSFMATRTHDWSTPWTLALVVTPSSAGVTYRMNLKFGRK